MSLFSKTPGAKASFTPMNQAAQATPAARHEPPVESGERSGPAAQGADFADVRLFPEENAVQRQEEEEEEESTQ